MIYVFHDNQITEEPDGTWLTDYPIGTYSMEPGNRWYKKYLIALVPINRCDLPPWVKALCLVGGIQP